MFNQNIPLQLFNDSSNPPNEGPSTGPTPIIIPKTPIAELDFSAETKVVIKEADVACNAAAPILWKIRNIINI